MGQRLFLSIRRFETLSKRAVHQASFLARYVGISMITLVFRNHAVLWDGKALTFTPAYDLCPRYELVSRHPRNTHT